MCSNGACAVPPCPSGQQRCGTECRVGVGACTAGAGACQRSGSYVCRGDNLGTYCDAVAATPTHVRGRFTSMSIEELQAKYLEAVGRATGTLVNAAHRPLRTVPKIGGGRAGSAAAIRWAITASVPNRVATSARLSAANWPMLREALERMGRADLIGNGKHHLVPRWQPQGVAVRGEGARTPRGPRKGDALTQHTGLPPRPRERDVGKRRGR